MDHSKYIALDVGGTSIKSGILFENGVEGEIKQTFINSKGSKEEILSVFKAIFDFHFAQLKGQLPCCLAIAFPGPFDYENGICKILGVQKYEAIYDVNLRKEFSNFLPQNDIPIFFCNDAEAAITGESQLGGGKGITKALGITLGTGLGGAFMIDGIPRREGKGVTSDGEIYYFKFKEEIGDDVFSIRGLSKRFAEANIQIKGIKEASEAARAGNQKLKEVFQQFGTDLGVFLLQITSEFEAEAVLALGGIANAADLFTTEVEAQINIPFIEGVLGQKAPLFGAVALAKITYF
ncbi:MAG: ROK family protein [Saprospiraceae bacterium]|jgi:glucokinase|nr:ROK family protein [Saprospiraceae bacterium]